MLLLLRTPEDILKLLELCIAVESVLLLGWSVLLHKVDSPVRSAWRCDRCPVLVDAIKLFVHLVEFKELLLTALLGLQELLGELTEHGLFGVGWQRKQGKKQDGLSGCTPDGLSAPPSLRKEEQSVV